MSDLRTSYIPADNSALLAPLYGATFRHAVSRFFRKYTTFVGRASRSEYWWVALLNVVVITVLLLPAIIYAASVDAALGQGLVGALLQLLLMVYLLGTIVPSIAVTVRRLHDANFSGWLVLVHLIPSLGTLIVAILALLPTNPNGIRFDKR